MYIIFMLSSLRNAKYSDIRIFGFTEYTINCRITKCTVLYTVNVTVVGKNEFVS